MSSFQKYLSNLNPKCNALWQRPKDSFDENDSIWYENKPLGKNALAIMMSSISKSAHLSKNYNNHCVRATYITVLSESGFEARHIYTSSGHRNEQSVRNYVRDTSNAQKRNMSASISSFTTTTHLTAATEHLDINASDDQQAVDTTLDNDIDENDLVMSAA